MNREAFENQYGADWRRFAELLERLERRRQSPATVLDRAAAHTFPELYRRICHHLALARSRRYGADLEQRLDRLAMRGHHQLYRRRAVSWEGIVRFFAADFPRQVRAEGRLFLVCLVLFFGPLFAMMALTARDPALVYTVVDPTMVEEFETMYDPATDLGRGPASDVLMFGLYIYNNISIAFRTFAGGILCGIGSIFILVYNGFVIGAVAGYVASVGFGSTFFPFVVGHGAFELTAIVLAGVSGLKLGLALVAPGRQRRVQALLEAGRESIRLVYGIAVLLVVAAFVEAFWSSMTWVPPATKYAAGAVAWTAVALYFLLPGRGHGS